jgi:thioredoxin reductase
MDADVIVVGGGSAGLQAALTLGRMRFEVIVVDEGKPSNAPAHAIGGLLGAHDLAPVDLLAKGREQLAELPSVRIVSESAERVAGLTVATSDGSFAARAVVLATGADYAVPDVPGISELWGDSVIHCPFCHGWESRDSRIGVLGADVAEHLGPMLGPLSGDVETFAEIAELRAEGGSLRAVVLPDGSEVERDVLFVAAPPRPRDASFAHLELERAESGQLVVDQFGRTGVPGIYAAGDLVNGPPAVVQAMATAQRAGVGVTRDLRFDG